MDESGEAGVVSRAVHIAGADAVRAMLFPFTCERDKYQCPAAGVFFFGREMCNFGVA